MNYFGFRLAEWYGCISLLKTGYKWPDVTNKHGLNRPGNLFIIIISFGTGRIFQSFFERLVLISRIRSNCSLNSPIYFKLGVLYFMKSWEIKFLLKQAYQVRVLSKIFTGSFKKSKIGFHLTLPTWGGVKMTPSTTYLHEESKHYILKRLTSSNFPNF